MKECDVSKQTLCVLSKYFNIRTEVTDITRANRIDVIASCKETNTMFGIEFKHTDKKRGEDIGNLINQCIRYSKTKFYQSGDYLTIPIFIAPPLSYDILVMNEKSIIFEGQEYIKDRHDKSNNHHTVNGMLGAFNVGELRNFGRYFAFIFSNKIIWSNRKYWGMNNIEGLHEKNYNNLMKKLNESINI